MNKAPGDAQTEPPSTTADKPKIILVRGAPPPSGASVSARPQQPASQYPATEPAPDDGSVEAHQKRVAAQKEQARKQREFDAAVDEARSWAVANGVPRDDVEKEISKTINEPSVHAPGPGYVVGAVQRLAQRRTGKSVEEMDKIYKAKKERAANDAFSAATGSGGGKPPAPPPVATGGEDDENNSNGKFSDNDKLQDHYARHGGDFGAKTSSEYEHKAANFLTRPRDGRVLERVRPNGDRVRYDPTTEEFGVVKPDGKIRTYYKPNPLVHGYSNNLDYFNAQ